MRDVNQETITGTLSWYKILPVIGFNPIRAKQRLVEPSHKPKVIYTDTSLEFGKTCEDQAWNHSTSTHRSETNGIAEIAIRREKEGTSAVLLQSGLDERWWSDSLDFCCHLRNVQDLLADGKTPDERRFGEPFMKGPIIPFGAMAESPVFTTRSIKTSSIWQEIVKLVSFLAMS